MDWRLLLPYVALHITSSYGFVAMSWRFYSVAGILMLVLSVAQIVANAVTHTRMKSPRHSATPENGSAAVHILFCRAQVAERGWDRGRL